MPDPTVVVTCPHCRHPYPMTDLQREVYKGRNMGCMNCGRPFKVDSAPQRAVNLPPEVAAPKPARQGEAGQAQGESSAAAGGGGSGVAVIGEGAGADAAHGTAVQAESVHADAAASAARAAVAVRPARGPAKFSPASNVPAVASVALGVLLFVFVAAAAVAGYAGSDDQLAPGSSRMGSGTPGTLLLLAIICGALAVITGGVGVFLSGQPVDGRTAQRSDGGDDAGAVPDPDAPPAPDPTPETPRGGKGYALTGLLLGGSGLLVGAVLAAMLLPSLNRAREEASRDRCTANLEQIKLALQVYLGSDPTGRGRFPDSLAPLLTHAHLRPEVLICPGSGDTVAPGNTATEQSNAILTTGGHQSYIYAGRGRTAQEALDKPDLVIAFEPLKNHGDGIHVLFADGKIVFVEKTLAAQLIGEINSGQNPPPAAQTIRPGG